MKDYEKAGVPMMPVVRGELETRRQILVYTVELVIVTLLLPILNLAGTVYLVSSLVLGGALIYAAWAVWKQGGNKVAWRMYRWSSYVSGLHFSGDHGGRGAVIHPQKSHEKIPHTRRVGDTDPLPGHPAWDVPALQPDPAGRLRRQ
jgi:hypothetical protein